jgi:hypothetical protein
MKPVLLNVIHAVATLGVALGALASCASTEYMNEGPGQPSDRASGSVPRGAIGVCKRPSSKRPPIVNPELWEHARPCTSRTPRAFIRLGYGESPSGAPVPEADREVETILDGIKQGRDADKGNAALVGMLRGLRDRASRDRELSTRVGRETARTTACDLTYMLNVMEPEHQKLARGSTCAANAYDPERKTEVCLFDTSTTEAVWLTSAWDCVATVNSAGDDRSCHRLCAYDDYCAKQVACAAPDIDLVMCTMGVCLPEPRAGF